MAKISVEVEYTDDKPDFEFSVNFHKKLKEFMPSGKKVIKKLPKVGKAKADTLKIEFEGYLDGKPESETFLEQQIEFGKFLKNDCSDFIATVAPITTDTAFYG